MRKPTVKELREYANEIGFVRFDPQAFIDHYDANGWRVGKVSMKDWKATVRNWKRREPEFRPRGPVMPYKTRQDKINELNRRKQELQRANAPYWKIHEIDMQLRKL